MKYLTDTHILLWSFIEPENLSEKIKKYNGKGRKRN